MALSITNTPVDQRLAHIRERMQQREECDTSLSGVSDLFSLLEDYLQLNSTLDKVAFLRGIFRVYREFESDHTYQDFIAKKLTSDERERLESFVNGEGIEKAGLGFSIPHSIGVREELEAIHKVNKAIIKRTKVLLHLGTENGDLITNYELNGTVESQHGFTAFVQQFTAFLLDSKHQDEIKIWDDVEFKNWGQTVSFTPKYTLWPQTVNGVINIIKFAIKKDLNVRCSGYRHSWSPIFGKNGQIQLSTMNPDKVGYLPDTTALPLWQDVEPTELESIDIIENSNLNVTPGKTLVRVGTACTNERLRRWCIGNNKVTLPLNVIMVEITLGGSNAPICHGAGRQHRTLSDLVRCIEYVDCNGNFQTVSDARQLKAASGAFGLLGVVTHITLEFDPMTYAQLAPKKLPVVVAVPPPDGYESKIPPALRVERTPEQRQQDIAAFEKACESDYYAEWFWFPYCDETWVNTWSNTTDNSDVVDFPDDALIFLQWLGTVMMNIAQYSKVLDTIGDWIGVDFTGATIISRAAMWMLGDRPLKTYLTDGLHFQRAIQNVRVRDIEVEIAIPAKAPSVSDWTVARRAWWDAILIAYEHVVDQPQCMPTEMRIMGDSDVLLSPQRGNKLGTCSIEVLTLESKRDKWLDYSQEVLDKWMSYTDADGQLLKTRPHWAKEWANHTVRGRPWKELLKEQYKDEVLEFRKTLEEIGKSQGWNIEDLRQRFGNAWLDEFIFGVEQGN